MPDTPSTSATIVAPDQHSPAPTIGIGFLPRVGARVLDLVFVMALSIPAAIAGVFVLAVLQGAGITDDGWPARMREAGVATFAFGALAGVLFHAVADTLTGATPGKLVLRMRVVNLDGRRCGLGAALLRNVAWFVDSFFFGMPAYSSMQRGPERQRHGDRWAKTMVISSDEARLHQPVRVLRIVLGLFVAILVAGATSATGIVIHSL